MCSLRIALLSLSFPFQFGFFHVVEGGIARESLVGGGSQRREEEPNLNFKSRVAKEKGEGRLRLINEPFYPRASTQREEGLR